MLPRWSFGIYGPGAEPLFPESAVRPGRGLGHGRAASRRSGSGQVQPRCMELLDRANTETYGTPEPTTVPLTVEKPVHRGDRA